MAVRFEIFCHGEKGVRPPKRSAVISDSHVETDLIRLGTFAYNVILRLLLRPLVSSQ